MISQIILKVIAGFVLTAIFALGPPLAFLMLPAAGMFLLLMPLWIMGVVGLMFLGFLITGRFAYATGVAASAIVALMSPLGWLAPRSIDIVQDAQRVNNAIRRDLKEKCAVDLPALKRASAKYDLLVLDDITTYGPTNHQISDTVAVLTGMRVVTIGRFHKEAYETTPTRTNFCSGMGVSNKVALSSRMSPGSNPWLAVDVCLSRNKIPIPVGDETPALVLRGAPVDATYCSGIEVAERTDRGEFELGRVHLMPGKQRTYPKLAAPNGIPQHNLLLLLLSEVLQQDLSDNALMKRAASAKK